jgi:transcriptional regulator with XRE-family HTH domain
VTPSPLPAALRALRTARKLDQGQLAALSGVSRGSISRYENSGKVPSWESLTALLHALGADLHELQDALDVAAGLEPRRLPPPDPDPARLLRLRMQHPAAAQGLLVELAQAEAEAHAVIARLERLQRAVQSAGPP